MGSVEIGIGSCRANESVCKFCVCGFGEEREGKGRGVVNEGVKLNQAEARDERLGGLGVVYPSSASSAPGGANQEGIKVSQSGRKRNKSERKEERVPKLTRQPHPHHLEHRLRINRDIVPLETFGVGHRWGIGGGESSGEGTGGELVSSRDEEEREAFGLTELHGIRNEPFRVLGW